MKLEKLPVVSLQTLVQDFFEKNLTVERQVSRHTVLAYRDGLKLFLRHAAERFECAVDQLDHTILDVEVVRSFLCRLKTRTYQQPPAGNNRILCPLRRLGRSRAPGTLSQNP